MGFLKQMKDMKTMVEAAPGMVTQAQQLGAQAQEMAAAQQAAATQAAAQAQAASEQAAAAGTASYEPIAGVSLELYAQISKGLAAHGYDQSKSVEIAAEKGVDADSWQQAQDGWNERIKSDPAVGQQFNRFYTAS
jgi:multidrug efflux pump subunit AcrA (membrane-fusion protein)